MQLAMLLWSYFSVVFTDPGAVPPNWRPHVDEERGETEPLTTSDYSSLQSMAFSDTGNPRIRYCRKCNQLKPPRSHHCSVCKFISSTLNSVADSNHQKIVILLYFLVPLIDHRWKVCAQDGSSLCMGCELCWSIELQILPSLPGTMLSILCLSIKISTPFSKLCAASL
jgi:hypothetical protein